MGLIYYKKVLIDSKKSKKSIIKKDNKAIGKKNKSIKKH